MRPVAISTRSWALIFAALMATTVPTLIISTVRLGVFSAAVRGTPATARVAGFSERTERRKEHSPD